MEHPAVPKARPFHVKSELSTSVPLQLSAELIRSHLAPRAPITVEQAGALAAWTTEIDRWQHIHRLVGWKHGRDLLERGLTDAWELAAFLADSADPDLSIVDLGAGNGLPGLILAVAFPARPLHLVERKRKRVGFLREAARKMGLSSVVVHHEDARAVLIPRPSLLVARAFEAPTSLLPLAFELGASQIILFLPEAPKERGAWSVLATRRSLATGQGFVLLGVNSHV